MKVQLIELKLSDERVVQATVPAFWDGDGELSIVGVRAYHPVELPPDYSFEVIETAATLADLAADERQKGA